MYSFTTDNDNEHGLETQIMMRLESFFFFKFIFFFTNDFYNY